MTHYEVLGIKPGATQAEVKSAYRALSQKYHPDVNDAANANTFFILINEAYEILRDENRRRAYDNELAHGGRTPPPPEREPTDRHQAVRTKRPLTPGRMLGKLLCILLFPVALAAKLISVVLAAAAFVLLALVEKAGTILTGLAVLVVVASILMKTLRSSLVPSIIGAAVLLGLTLAAEYLTPRTVYIAAPANWLFEVVVDVIKG